MARLHGMSTIILLVLLSVRLSLSADPLENAPTPAPEIGGDSVSPSSGAGAPESPSQSPEFSSPPAPPPSDLAHASSPAPPPADSLPKKSPAPAPDDSADNSDSYPYAEKVNESSGGMKGGQKAGIVVGVVAGVCLVGLGGMVYKKRQENLRRSQYGYAARTGLL